MTSNVYEMLKNGKTVDDLRTIFEDELSRAKEMIAQEEAEKREAEAAAKERELFECRENLFDAIDTYVEALYDKDIDDLYPGGSHTLENEFIKMEEGIKKASKFLDIFEEKMDEIKEDIKNDKSCTHFKNGDVEIHTKKLNDEDAEVIKRFIESLK